MDQNDLDVDGDIQPRSAGLGRPTNYMKEKQFDQDERFNSQYSSGYSSAQGMLSGDFDSFSNIRKCISADQADSGLDSGLQSVEKKPDIRKEVEQISKITEKISLTGDEDEGVVVSFNSTGAQSLDDVITSDFASKTAAKPHVKCKNVNDRVTSEALTIYGKDSDGDTLLHIAIINSAISLSLNFIQMAPWFDWLDIYNENLRQTPLHLAVHMNLVQVVRRLMIGGANIEMSDHRGDTPLHIACQQGKIDIVTTLLEPLKPEEVEINDYEVPFQKIPQNLEIRNFSGCTCLHVAADNGQMEILRLLLAKGARVNSGDGKRGATCLHYAADKNDKRLTAFLLLQKGINIDSKMYNGATPIVLAHGRRNTDIVNILQRCGARDEEMTFSDSDSDCDV